MTNDRMTQILVLSINEATNEQLCELRDYVLQSISIGVLVLDEKWGIRIEKLPPLGEVKVEMQRDVSACKNDYTPQKKRGRKSYAESKREILQELIQFRKEFGLGCFSKIADECGPDIDVDMLQRVVSGDSKLGMDDWKKISTGIQKARERMGSVEVT